MKDKIAKWLGSVLDKYGIDPIYLSTIICILLSLYYINEFKNWSNSPFSHKLLAISTVFGTVILIFLSLFRLLGKIKV